LDVRRAHGNQRRLDAATTWPGTTPGRDRVLFVVAGAPPPTRTIERVLDEMGCEFIQLYGLTKTSPLVTINRQRAEWDELDSQQRARRLGRAGVPALGGAPFERELRHLR